MEGFRESLYKSRTVADRLQCIELEILEIKEATSKPPQQFNIEENFKALETSIKTTLTAKTYAQAAGPSPIDKKIQNRQQQEKHRQENAKYEVLLTAKGATEEVNQKLSTTRNPEITAKCQQAIEAANIFTDSKKPKLQGVNKREDNTIKIQCKSEDEANQLRSIDWTIAYEGLEVHKPKFGIVVHGVAKKDLILTTDNTAVKQLQEENPEIRITKVGPLRRKDKIDRTHHSIVIFTEDAHAADQAIRFGYYINCTRHTAERYTPHLQATQCFKCYKYRHIAKHCKRKQKCGKCTKDHETKECTSEQRKCLQCNGEHKAWHHAHTM